MKIITDDYTPKEILEHLNPASCTYTEWLSVGMALKQAGESCTLWDTWSRLDPLRYHDGECQTKWLTFNGAAMRDVTIGTVVQMALNKGWIPEQKNTDQRIIGWDDEFVCNGDAGDDDRVIDVRWVQEEDVPPCVNFNPVDQTRRYIQTLFHPDEYVCYVASAHEHRNEDGTVSYSPTRGVMFRAGEIIDKLDACHGDVGAVFGDFHDEYGAWVRFNPMDGQDVKDQNVTAYRYALVECDVLSISKQYALIKQLQLPVAILVHSGKKSLHAIVKIGAETFTEYREKVDYLYKVCEKNGLKLDTNNRNPSRLSRFPGATRNGNPQYIVDAEFGCKDYEEWHDYIESLKDDLPDIVSFADFAHNLPPLAPELIHGILRKGHKMLLSGPSKAGKSFALIELCIAIAEGKWWLGFECAKGRVLYINLELDPNSCLHRFSEVYSSLGVESPTYTNIDIWHLRGKGEPLDKLAPKLIRRCKETKYAAIIIDPIYKVITGDENSADQMAAFCNEFDRISAEMGCSVIYCHHHSKGSQAGKRAADRASGSGVFARDPDAMIDMIQVDVSDDKMDAVINENKARWIYDWYKGMYPYDYDKMLAGVDLGSASDMMSVLFHNDPETARYVQSTINTWAESVDSGTLWQIEGTLREFKSFEPFKIWFRYPIHTPANESALEYVKPKGALYGSDEARQLGLDAMAEGRKKKMENNRMLFAEAVEECDGDYKKVLQYCGKSAETIRRWIKEFGYEKDGEVVREVK